VTLANGRRADVVGLSHTGEIWIVEVKSCVADYRSDQKWREYLEFADRFFFAVSPEFPAEILPGDCGLILADRFGGEIARPGGASTLAPARRKAMTLRLARVAAFRLAMTHDPELGIRSEAKET
jgi:hypothetical protein